MKSFLILVLTVLATITSTAQSTKAIWALYNQKQYAQTIESGLKALKHQPYNGEINLAVGRSYFDTQQYDKAIHHLQLSTKTNNLDWVRGWAYNYLGQCHGELKDEQTAQHYFKKCITLNATKNSVASSKRLLNSLKTKEYLETWYKYETEHLIFHFQDTSAIDNIQDYMRVREIAYENINVFFEALPFKKIDYYIWAKPNDAEKLLGRTLGWASPKSCTIHSSIHQTRGHEITHILCFYGMKPTYPSRLINEGIAVYFDQTNRDYMKVAQKHLDGQKLDVLTYWENPKTWSDEYNYTVGGALIECLYKHGNAEQMKALLANQSIESARKIYPAFDQIMDAFQQELNNR
ncbi:MAG: hypothetical protein JEZ14_12405 [Marinilabiliaceae bacterium]|nr:hypothetical protein [Marinilabiliaceae bacterium]